MQVLHFSEGGGGTHLECLEELVIVDLLHRLLRVELHGIASCPVYRAVSQSSALRNLRASSHDSTRLGSESRQRSSAHDACDVDEQAQVAFPKALLDVPRSALDGLLVRHVQIERRQALLPAFWQGRAGQDGFARFLGLPGGRSDHLKICVREEVPGEMEPEAPAVQYRQADGQASASARAPAIRE